MPISRKPVDRSEYVHLAMESIPNRFHLCRYAAKGTRILHTGSDRIEDTTNAILESLRWAAPSEKL